MCGESVVRNDTNVTVAMTEIYGNTRIMLALFWKMYRAWIYFDPLRRIDYPLKLLLFPWTRLKIFCLLDIQCVLCDVRNESVNIRKLD
jgi:hypothetical protein